MSHLWSFWKLHSEKKMVSSSWHLIMLASILSAPNQVSQIHGRLRRRKGVQLWTIPIVQKRASSKYEQLLAQCCVFLMVAAVGEKNKFKRTGFHSCQLGINNSCFSWIFEARRPFLAVKIPLRWPQPFQANMSCWPNPQLFRSFLFEILFFPESMGMWKTLSFFTSMFWRKKAFSGAPGSLRPCPSK